MFLTRESDFNVILFITILVWSYDYQIFKFLSTTEIQHNKVHFQNVTKNENIGKIEKANIYLKKQRYLTLKKFKMLTFKDCSLGISAATKSARLIISPFWGFKVC